MPAALASRSALRTACLVALLFGGTLLVYSRSAGFGFVNYDDPSYVTDNPVVQGGLSRAGIMWAFTAPADYWHPLTWLSHMLDWQLYGPNAAGHHLTSVLWHALNAVLAFLVFRTLTGAFWRSAFAAMLFAWHPLRVESVVWVTERKDVMSGCFFLLTLLAYARYVERRRIGLPGTWPYLLALGCFAAGLMSKPVVVMLPLLLLVLDVWPFRRAAEPAKHARPRLIAEKLPFFGLAAAAALATVAMQRNIGAFVLELPLAARLGNAAVSLPRYLGKFLWPANLMVCYRHPGFWPALTVLGAVAIVIALGVFAWRQRHRRPWIATGLAWYLIALLPVIGLVQAGFQSMADRYTYLPMLGVELAVIWSLPAMTSRLGKIAMAAAASAVITAAAFATWRQQGYWRDSVSLFTHAVQVDNLNDVAEDFLASALIAEHRYDEARWHAQRARGLNPHNDAAFVTLADLEERQGKLDEAATLYRTALIIRPSDPLVRCQLGLAELRLHHEDAARSLMTSALRAKPRLRDRALEVGQAALRSGDLGTACVLADIVLSVDPDNAIAHAELGLTLFARHEPAAALSHLRLAVKAHPADADAQLALSICAEQAGETAEAATALARAAEAAGDNAPILMAIADRYARREEIPDAIKYYRRAIAVAPRNPSAHAALGYLLVYTGDRAGGIAEWKRALALDPSLARVRDRLRQMEP